MHHFSPVLVQTQYGTGSQVCGKVHIKRSLHLLLAQTQKKVWSMQLKRFCLPRIDCLSLQYQGQLWLQRNGCVEVLWYRQWGSRSSRTWNRLKKRLVMLTWLVYSQWVLSTEKWINQRVQSAELTVVHYIPSKCCTAAFNSAELQLKVKFFILGYFHLQLNNVRMPILKYTTTMT